MNKIKRKKRNTPFVQIDRTALQDSRLSWKCRGLLAYLLSLPDEWEIYVNELTNHATDGRDSTSTAINELIKFGYIVRERKTENGKFKGFNYTVSDIPFLLPKTEKPKTEKPKTENPKLNNNIIKDYKTNNIKRKKLQKKKVIETVDFPEIFEQNQQLKNKFLEFEQMRREIKKPYKTKTGIQRILKRLESDCFDYGIDLVIQSIEKSIESEYMGIFTKDLYLKQKQNEKFNSNTEPESIYESFARSIGGEFFKSSDS
jgi:hypothetical protein